MLLSRRGINISFSEKMKRHNIILQWWRTIDRWLLANIIFIATIGIILIISSSPSIANRIHIKPFYFVERHTIYLAMAAITLLIMSFLNENLIRYLSAVGMIISILLLVIVLCIGTEIKGAHRWLYFAGISIQPSEFVKTFFAVFNAVLLGQGFKYKYILSLLLYSIIAILIILEPDFGMTLIITIILISQFFVSGINFKYILLAGILLILGSIISYITVPHIQHRVNNFLNPSIENNFQVNKSLSAFKNGGIFGVGPGEGSVKFTIPDSHTDFIFAVAGEEFGALFCFFIITSFLFLTLKSLNHITDKKSDFHAITITGLIVEIAAPAVINMGVNLNLLPTKGMVLPLISYGGSSIVASSIALGIILSLTKTKFSTVREQI